MKEFSSFIAEELFKKEQWLEGFDVCRENGLKDLYSKNLELYGIQCIKDKKYLELLNQLVRASKFIDTPFMKKQAGLVLWYLNKHEDSLKYLVDYEKLYPKDLTIYTFLGDLYSEKGDHCSPEQEDDYKQKAIYYYEQALKIYPEEHTIYGNLAGLYADIYTYGEEETQMYYARTAYKLRPDHIINILNMLLVTCKYGMIDEAKKFFELAKQKSDLTPGVLFSFGCALIRNKEFEDGFKLYRYRIEHNPEALPNGLHDIWNPDVDLKDKTLLVTYEQGYGDTLMFVRFINEMKPLCKELKIVVQEELYSLLNENFPVYSSKDLTKIEYDYFLPIMDVPLFIHLNPDNIPYKDGYLKVTGKSEYVNKNDKFKIGICYGGSSESEKQCRDLALAYFYPLLDMDAEVYSFQREDTYKQLDKAPKSLIKIGHLFKDWRETAQAMNEMDLMITVDCGVLNLAGALGVKTFALFNKYPEFRWLNLINGNPWYNMETFQCKEFNSWKEPMDRVIKETQKLIEEKKCIRT
jgi:hypothetical protein